ncbi:MAG: hypothetical protein M1415_11300 [Firmicutes bacterium]|jgi:hypothetical protein|nr:hypothetical protein [Bacillota bacterium]
MVLDDAHRAVAKDCGIYETGLGLANGKAVILLAWDRPSLLADVANEDGGVFHTRVDFVHQNQSWVSHRAWCSCLSKEPWCAHALAVVMVAETESAALLEAPTLERRVADLRPEQIQSFLQEKILADDQGRFAIARGLGPYDRSAEPPIDGEQVARDMAERVRIMAEREANRTGYGENCDEAYDQLDGMLQTVQAALNKGHVTTAAALLFGLSEGFCEVFEWIDETGENTMDFAAALSEMWVRMIFENMTQKDRSRLSQSVGRWQAALTDIGLEMMEEIVFALTFGNGAEALHQGTLADARAIPEMVAAAWLEILERQGDNQAYRDYLTLIKSDPA